MLESNPPRNSHLKLIVSMSEGVVCEDRALIEMIDFPMPEKTHKGSCRAAASLVFCARSPRSNSAGGK